MQDANSGVRASAPGEAKKSPPPLASQVWNLAKSLATFVVDGLKTVDKEQYEARLAVCNECEERRGDRCLKCGCRLSLKAKGRAFACPLGKWAELGEEVIP